MRRFLTLPQVCDVVGFGRTWVRDAIAAGRFPEPTRIGPRAVRWDSAKVEAWIAETVAADDSTGHDRPSTTAPQGGLR